MPVTFGTVQVIAPQSQGGSASGGGAPGAADAPAGGAPPPPPRPREMVPVMRHLRDRATRLRAH
jgi:hypothetical protein